MSTIKVDDVEALSTNGNLQIAPNGTGVVEVKGENNDATLQLNDDAQRRLGYNPQDRLEKYIKSLWFK